MDEAILTGWPFLRLIPLPIPAKTGRPADDGALIAVQWPVCSRVAAERKPPLGLSDLARAAAGVGQSSGASGGQSRQTAHCFPGYCQSLPEVQQGK